MLHKAISNLKNQDGEGEGGFTLIELLVVILIIGILAAIALPTFLGQSNKAKDSSAKSDIRNAVSQVESCLADGAKTADVCTTKGSDSATSNPDLNQFDSLKTGFQVSHNDANGAYAIRATSETGNTFTITKSASGGYARTCTVSKDGAGCSANGASW